ncbi:MAG: PAS domain-containing protein, partial [Thermoanaerobaculia bacterium]
MRALLLKEASVCQAVLEEALRERGHELAVTDDPSEAFARLRPEPHPFLVLWRTDPAETVELCRLARGLPHARHGMVLVVTRDGSPAHARALMEAGADDWLIEPVDAELLRLRLRMAERRLADLAGSEERYRGLFDGVPIGLYRTTPAGRLLDANDALVRTLGFPD